MHSENLEFEGCENDSHFKVKDKDSQTNEGSKSNEGNSAKESDCSVKSYKLPLPRELEQPDEGVVKAFSYSQLIQDPDSPKSIIIIRESFTEEVHQNAGTPNDQGSSNRYRYCKEIIKPFLKDYPPDCPNSRELLLRDAVAKANEEFPECPPCYEERDCEGKAKNSDSHTNKCDTGSETTDTCSKKCDTSPKKSGTCPKKSNSCAKNSDALSKDPAKKDKKHLIICPGQEVPKICVECNQETCPDFQEEKSEKESSSSCPKEPKEPKKKPCPPKKSTPETAEFPNEEQTLNSLNKISDDAKHCAKNKMDDNPSENLPKLETKQVHVQAETLKARKSECSTTAEAVQSAIDAHNQTMATLKYAMEDFMCKIYKSTQDAVTLIRSESAKQFQKLRNSDSDSTCKTPPKEVNYTTDAVFKSSSPNLRRFSLENMDNTPTEQKDPISKSPDNTSSSESPVRYLFNKVDSVVSMISDSLVFELPKPKKPRTYNDSSSKYDVPAPSRYADPKDIENVMFSGTSSLFITLKDKIWSMFCEDGKADITSKPSSTESSSSESDEDLLNKFID